MESKSGSLPSSSAPWSVRICPWRAWSTSTQRANASAPSWPTATATWSGWRKLVSNPNFREKARPDVVENEEARLADLRERKQRLDEILQQLGR